MSVLPRSGYIYKVKSSGKSNSEQAIAIRYCPEKVNPLIKYQNQIGSIDGIYFAKALL
jgi:hypothetical protein